MVLEGTAVALGGAVVQLTVGDRRRSSAMGGAAVLAATEGEAVVLRAEAVVGSVLAVQSPVLQPWMVMGLGMCMQSRGVRGTWLEGPIQETALDWMPYPHDAVHWDTQQ